MNHRNATSARQHSRMVKKRIREKINEYWWRGINDAADELREEGYFERSNCDPSMIFMDKSKGDNPILS